MNKNITVDIQIADDLSSDIISTLPSEVDINTWLSMAYAITLENTPNERQTDAKLRPEIGLRIVSVAESRALNAQYRGKEKPTNVLSFESDLPDFVPSAFLGDLAVCAQVVSTEAQEQQKNLQHHWAHMCIHGTLHLMGFDHIDNQDALEMENLEILILAKLGIDDPYQIS